MKQPSFYLFKKLTLIIILLGSLKAKGANYYWVKGSGSWSDLTHWATSSGGSTFHNQVPTFKDNVYFDANSFTAVGEEIVLNVSNAVCNSFIWDGVKNKPKFSSSDKSYSIRIYGNLQLDKNMDFAYNGYFTFESLTTGNTIQTANFNVQKFEFVGLTGEWSLQDSMKSYGDAEGLGIILKAGHLKTNGNVIQTTCLVSQGANYRKLSLGSSQVNLINRETGWYVTDNNFYLDAGTSTINLLYQSWRKHFFHRAHSPKSVFYNLVDHHRFPTDYVGDYFSIIDSTSFNRIEIKSTINNAEFMGLNIKTLVCHERIDMLRLESAKIGKLELRNTANIDGSFSVDTLFLKGGATYEFAGNSIVTVNKHLNWKGACGAFIYIKSNNPLTDAKFEVSTSITQNIDYCKFHHIAFSGSAIVKASNMIPTGTVSGLVVNSNYAPLTFYWIGGKGKWSDFKHWSNSSGGSSQSCIPGPSDNVVFDKNSFGATSDTLFLNLRENMCGSLLFTKNALSGSGK
jgi:hypothetical protein